MELHEAGPGLVEHDVIAEMPDPLQHVLRAVDRAVIGTLLDDGDPERPLGTPGFRIGDERIGADRLADRGLVERPPDRSALSTHRHCGSVGR